MHRKPIFFLLLISLGFAGCEASLVPNEGAQTEKYISFHDLSMTQADKTAIPKQTRERYRLDAEIMAVRYIHGQDKTQEKLPENLIDIFYNGLLHIYNSDLKTANVVTNKYTIHVFQRGLSRRLYLSIKDGQEWTKAWINGILHTGNKKVDQLVEKYNYKIKEVYQYQTIPSIGVVLHSEKPLNQFAVADHFKTIKGIRGAGPGFSAGDGNNIKFSMGENRIKFIFSKGWGDCPSGCIARHFWSFKVFSDGTVKFVKEWGAPIEGKM